MSVRTQMAAASRWASTHRKHIAFAIGAVLILIIAAQMLYPQQWALPFARAMGVSVGMQHRNDVVAHLQRQFDTAQVQLINDDMREQATLADLGAELNTDAMAAHVTDYTLLQRLMPLSILMMQPSSDAFSVTFTESRLQDRSASLAKKLSRDATNAGITLKDGTLAVTEASDGSKVEPKSIMTALRATQYSVDTTRVPVAAEHISPEVDDASIADVREQVEAILSRPTQITVADEQFNPDEATITSWLQFDKADDGIRLVGKTAAIRSYVESIASKTRIEPQPNNVKLVDGEQVSASGGAPGKSIHIASATEVIEAALFDQQPTMKLTIDRQDITPPAQYQRSYTSSQKGLRAYANAISSDGTIKLAVTQLNGNGWRAAGRTGDSLPSASTYKLFVMMHVFDEIQQGKLDWSDSILDTNTSGCFERMIVVSTNACAQEWLSRFGRQNMNNFVYDKGFSTGTTFTSNVATHTTANDLNTFITRLEQGSLLGDQHRDMLLEKMGRQIHRQGVPAGTSAPVFNKVGFLWDYVHDAAIVRHPRGTYTIVVMTKGHSYQKIADVTRQVERILYP